MEKVIVTGAGGFIGSWLVNELIEHGIKVTVISRSPDLLYKKIKDIEKIKIISCDLKNIDQISSKLSSADVFYHLAWRGSSGNERADYNIQTENACISAECIKVAAKTGCSKFISMGTVTEMIIPQLKEGKVNSASTIYAITKEYTDKLLSILSSQLDINYTWCRLSNVYGLGNETQNLLGYTINTLKKGEKPVFSTAEQPYNFIYIKDCIRALIAVGNLAKPKSSYFIGGMEVKKLKEFLTIIKDEIDKSAVLGIGERPDDGIYYKEDWFSIKDIVEDTGFKPLYSFQDGIREMVSLMQSRRQVNL